MPPDTSSELRPPVYVDSNAALEKVVRTLRAQPAIAVDTESNPLFAYREKLCLVQISTRTRDYIVDPLARIDLGQLLPVFADPGIMKVLHDAEFDVLMLKRTIPFEITGIFDTKVVATSLGLETVSLASILQSCFGVTLDKRFQRSDWGRRPLSEGQVDYARYDTHFLLPLAADLQEQLAAREEIHQLEVAAEFRRVEALVPELRPFNPDDFTRIKGWDRLDPGHRRVLRELYVMRHEIADRLDRPAFKVLPNDVLLRLTKAQPLDREALERAGILSEKLRDRYGRQVLAAIARGRRLAPLPDARIQRTKKNGDFLDDDQRAVYEELRCWRKKIADRRRTDASLVLPKSVMLSLAALRHVPRDLDGLRQTGLLEPWRVQYYGEGILAALRLREVRRGARASRRSRRGQSLDGDGAKAGDDGGRDGGQDGGRDGGGTDTGNRAP